jgi:hypothetical protein
VARRIAEVYWKHKDELREAFAGCSLEARGYAVDEILDYLYSKVRRVGHQVLDEQGFSLWKLPEGETSQKPRRFAPGSFTGRRKPRSRESEEGQ